MRVGCERGVCESDEGVCESDVKEALSVACLLVVIYKKISRAEVRRSFITTTDRDESQVTPQGRHR